MAPASPAAAAAWLPAELGLHPDTAWSGRRIELPHGGWLLLLRESHAGHPIAGARLALRVGPDGRLRQIIGTGISPAASLTSVASWPAEAALWWPTAAGLVPARIEEGPLAWASGRPHQERRYVDAATGETLARESMIDEIIVPIRGWPENPLITPEVVDYDVPLSDFDAILLEDSVFKVFQCNWDEEKKACDPIYSPVAALPEELLLDPPPIDDVEAHADPTDPHAALQFMQFAARVQPELSKWGWDPYAWDDLDCAWQGTDDPVDCRVWVHVNVLAQDEDGVYPFSGAFYRSKGQIFMGQGINADTSFDGDIVIHEIGHHVTHSYGKPEPTEMTDDGARLYTDISAINEASSDFLARMMGTNDRIYDYYSAVEPGTYVGPRIRDVSVPFRCPENVVGEVHMDGRIWVSAIMDGFVALEDAGLADKDAYASTYLGALGAIRHIPREQRVQLPDAREIFLDEVELNFGAEGRDIVEDIFDDRAIGTCDYMIDIREEPSLAGEVDPEDVLAARFMVFLSHIPEANPDTVDQNPWAPPLQHQIALTEDEGGLLFRFRPNVWRPPRPVDEVDLSVAALVKHGNARVEFTRDPETGVVSNDADLRFVSEPDGESAKIVIEGLTPGMPHTIALVSLSTISGDKLMMEDMTWETLPAPPPEDDTDDTGDDTQGGGETDGTDDAGAEGGGGGCGCFVRERGAAPNLAWMILLGLAGGWRRRSLVAGCRSRGA